MNRTGRTQQGFSLLEIIVTLAIASVLITVFAVRFSEASSGENLIKPASGLRKIALMANRQSSAFRKEYFVTFYPDGFFLSQRPIPDRIRASQSSFEEYLIPNLDPPVEFQIRRLGNSKWIRPNGAEWKFQPAGLCEPIEVRFQQEEEFIELRFNPMTAEVEEERFQFR